MKVDFILFGYWFNVRKVEDCTYIRAVGDKGVNLFGYNFLIEKIW